jgi:hypothetical protein
MGIVGKTAIVGKMEIPRFLAENAESAERGA